MVWNWVELKDVCSLIVDCVNRTAPVVDTITPYRMIRTSNVKNGRIELSDTKYVSEETFKRWTRRAIPKQGDIVLTREAPLGEVGMIREENVFLGQRLMMYRADEHNLHHRFLLYALLSEPVQHEIRAMGSGSTVEHMRVGDTKKIKIPLPPLEEQRPIAHILGSLDDKIEANRRMNETLEATARAIFKSWFVDFDPVQAKANGEQPYGMDAATAALFPESFQESELGLIPSGWDVNPISEIIQILGGGTPKTSINEYWNGDIFWYSVRDVPANSDVWVIKTEKTITQAGVDNSSTKVLPFGTTIISARGTVGKLALVGVPMGMNQSCYAIRGIAENMEYYIFFLLRSVIDEIQQRTHGTVFDTITTRTFDTLSISIPNLDLVQRFHCEVEPLLGKIRNNLMENETLAELRDTLLPRLISGALQVDSWED